MRRENLLRGVSVSLRPGNSRAESERVTQSIIMTATSAGASEALEGRRQGGSRIGASMGRPLASDILGLSSLGDVMLIHLVRLPRAGRDFSSPMSLIRDPTCFPCRIAYWRHDARKPASGGERSRSLRARKTNAM
jgi:hypothetical protein